MQELETYANNYAGLGRIYRLMFIADHSPKLRAGALKLALAQVVTTMNTSLYESLYRKLKQCERLYFILNVSFFVFYLSVILADCKIFITKYIGLK